jgi:site-specific DNA-methyltransferase (cytosine-N4-specific)
MSAPYYPAGLPTKLHYADESVTLWHGDALDAVLGMDDASVNCCVTSPPYFGLRDYGVEGQLGLEASPAEYVENMRALFHQVRRVLADDGTLWLNLGDSYNANPGQRKVTDKAGPKQTSKRGSTGSPSRSVDGLAPKNMIGIPWRVAFALQDDGWILRNDIIWAKPNAMPESVMDRMSTTHEHLFLLTKSQRYWFDIDPIRAEHAPAGLARRKYAFQAEENRANLHDAGDRPANPLGKNPGDVWSIPTQPFSAAHFAVMPRALAERAIQAGCKPGGTVLDPFSGSGTTGLAAARHGRKYVGIDLNAEYLDMSLRTRLAQPGLDFGEGA